MERKQFTFYRSYYKSLEKLSSRRRMEVLEAVIRYALDGEEPQKLDKVQYMAFELIRPTLQASRRKALSGMLGKVGSNKGEKKKEKEEEKEVEKETEIEKETETETEIEKEIEKEIEDECLSGEGFDIFWKAYPLKLGKETARKAWDALGAEKTAKVLSGLYRWNRCVQWQQENGRYIPRAARFLEEEYFSQDPPGYVPMGATGELGKAEMEAIAAVMKED